MENDPLQNDLDGQRNHEDTWFRDKGWFSSAYYYPVRLSPWKKAAGWLFDVLGRGIRRRV
jgi:hypothetical protein